MQQLWSDTGNETGQPIPIALHDIPGGEEAFELCAKFCYGISINLSAHNFVPAISAAKFLRMTESVAKGNFTTKLESFFESCILQGWKDSIVTLQTVWRQSGWSDEHRIVQPCLTSVIEKILVHPLQVCDSATVDAISVLRHFRSLKFSSPGCMVLHLHKARLPKEAAKNISPQGLVDGGCF